jgi:hypothetical protein
MMLGKMNAQVTDFRYDVIPALFYMKIDIQAFKRTIVFMCKFYLQDGTKYYFTVPLQVLIFTTNR